MFIMHTIVSQINLKYSADPVCYDASTDCGTTGTGSTVSHTTMMGCCGDGGMSFDANDGSSCAVCPGRVSHAVPPDGASYCVHKF